MSRQPPIPTRTDTLFPSTTLSRAKARARSDHPQLRQELARLYTDTRTGLWNAQRGKAEAARGGGQAVASIGKLTQTNIVKRAARLGVEILGADGTLADGDGVESGVYATAFVFSAASSIYGGSEARKSTRLNSSH